MPKVIAVSGSRMVRRSGFVAAEVLQRILDFVVGGGVAASVVEHPVMAGFVLSKRISRLGSAFLSMFCSGSAGNVGWLGASFVTVPVGPVVNVRLDQVADPEKLLGGGFEGLVGE